MNSSLESTAFPAKLLLFGEHVLLLGATALAVPVQAFKGNFENQDLSTEAAAIESIKHHQRLLQFAQSEALAGIEGLQTAQFERDLKAGLYFKSNIPTGYGLGSSGALCAAIYDRYMADKSQDLAELKTVFARMESFFHGNSSGIDPLTSFVGAPILIQHKTTVQQASVQPWKKTPPVVFLIDSGLPRRTGPLVEWFLAQSKDAVFYQKLSEEYLPVHEAMVKAWLNAEEELFWPNLRQISAYQWSNFAPMIPETMRDFWLKNLDSQDVVLKICGAGGGGFMLGFARDIDSVKRLPAQFRIVYP